MTGIQKRFGPVNALIGVDLEVQPGEVHGLLGGNGAGKTTLMNVLYGLYDADGGAIEIDGSTATIKSPRDALAAGVGMVHQTFLQVDNYSGLENVVLGAEAGGSIFSMNLDAARAKVQDLSTRFGLAVDPDAIVEELPVGIRQRVEILKALYRGSKILILDEPTTNLTPQEVDDLFGSIHAMVAEGMSVILITHKIQETMSICDCMTIMRLGEKIAVLNKVDTTPDELAAIMVGETAGSDARAVVLGED
ncbi:MAG: ATP-binding cassette domain-containing protein, partial [Actinomycetales bacterium]|nr:ATP-binding cassette domain-containing protein [Actinomycetales bacterium]